MKRAWRKSLTTLNRKDFKMSFISCHFFKMRKLKKKLEKFQKFKPFVSG
jgi:hypothetical protein